MGKSVQLVQDLLKKNHLRVYLPMTSYAVKTLSNRSNNAKMYDSIQLLIILIALSSKWTNLEDKAIRESPTMMKDWYEYSRNGLLVTRPVHSQRNWAPSRQSYKRGRFQSTVWHWNGFRRAFRIGRRQILKQIRYIFAMIYSSPPGS